MLTTNKFLRLAGAAALLVSAGAVRSGPVPRAEVFHCSGTENQVAHGGNKAFSKQPTDAQILIKDKSVVIGAAPVFAMNELPIRHEVRHGSGGKLDFMKAAKLAVYAGEFDQGAVTMKLSVNVKSRPRWWAEYQCRPVRHGA